MADDAKQQAHLARLRDFDMIGTNVRASMAASSTGNDDFDRVLKLGVESGLKLIPYVGGFLAGMAGILWPDPTEPNDVWDSIEARVAALCQDLIDQNKAHYLRNQLAGFQNLLNLYIKTSPSSPQKAGFFNNLVALTQTLAPSFLDPSAPQYTLVYAVPMCTLYLGILREQVLFWEDIYGGPDPDAAMHYQLLQDTILQYKSCLVTARAAAIAWRKSKITVVNKGDPHFPDCDWYITDPLWLTNGQPWVFHVGGSEDQHNTEKDTMTAFCNQRIDENYGASLDKLFLASRQWLFMDPAAIPLLMVGTEPQNYLAQCYPCYYFDTFCYNGMLGNAGNSSQIYFDDAATAAQEGILTKIVIRAGDRVDGFECFYGRNKVSTGFRGNPNGGTAHTFDIPQLGPQPIPPTDPNNLFTRLSGFNGILCTSGLYLNFLMVGYNSDPNLKSSKWTGGGNGEGSQFYCGLDTELGTTDQCNGYVPGSVISHVWGYYSASGIEGLCIAWVHPETLSYDQSASRVLTGAHEAADYSSHPVTHTLMPKSQIYPESYVMEWSRPPSNPTG